MLPRHIWCSVRHKNSLCGDTLAVTMTTYMRFFFHLVRGAGASCIMGVYNVLLWALVLLIVCRTDGGDWSKGK